LDNDDTINQLGDDDNNHHEKMQLRLQAKNVPNQRRLFQRITALLSSVFEGSLYKCS